MCVNVLLIMAANNINNLSMNSDHSPSRIELRRQYQELCEQLDNDECDKEVLKRNLVESDELIDRVSKPREAMYDSMLLNKQVDKVKQHMDLIQTSIIQFDPVTFAKKFKILCTSNGNRDFMLKFGERSQNIMSLTPGLLHVNNLFEADETIALKPKKVRQAKVKDKVEELKKPLTLDNNEGSPEATKIALRIYVILEKWFSDRQEPVSYFTFVTNPKSFSETVENMFYVSLLAKEGLVKIVGDQDNVPYIYPVDEAKAKEAKLHGKYNQAIISISPKEFREIVDAFNIQVAMIDRKKIMT